MRKLLVAALLLLSPAPVLAQPICAPVDEVRQALLSEFGERPVSMGKATGLAIVTFANPETGTFTIIAVRPDGLACHLASGEGWRATNLRETAS